MKPAIIKLPAFLAGRLKMASAEMRGYILEQNDRAIHFKGTAVLKHSRFCLRCGREITNPASMVLGYGPECGEHIGIPRDFTEEQLDRVREAVRQKTEIQLWLPRMKVDISYLDDDGAIVDGPEENEPAPQQPAAQAGPPKVKIYTKAKRIFLEAPFTFKDYCKAIEGHKWEADLKNWSYPASPATAEKLMATMCKVMTEHNAGQFITPETDDTFMELVKQNITIASAQAKKTSEDLEPVPITKHPAWLHQLQAFWFGWDLPGVMYAMGMGTGKSKVTVDTIVNKEYKRTLIMGPKAAVAVWPKEFKKHGGREVHVVSLVTEKMQNWTVKRKVEHATKEIALAEAKGLQVVICINYEAAWRDEFADWAMKQKFECVVCDESHKIKSPGGKASRFAAKIGERAEKRMALSGTPMAHSPLDAYAQYRFLDPGIFGTNYSKFKNRYAITQKLGNTGVDKVVGYQREDELNAKFYSIAYRVGSEVLDLPPAMNVEQEVHINAKARRFYKELERDLVAAIAEASPDDALDIDIETGRGVVTVDNALTKLLRLQQITSGYVQDDEGNIVQVDTAKRDALEDILESIGSGEPVVVFAKFRHDLDAIKEITEKMELRYGELSGRQNDLVDACMPEWADVLGVQIQAGGAGIDLTRACYAVYYSVGYSLGDYEQSLARIHRPGQTRPVRNIHIIAENTVDEKVYAALENKKKIIDYVLSAF